jgi:hypothetical protein
MPRLTLLTAGFLAAILATPVAAQEATQEPGAMAQHYPQVDYLTGGYGHRFTPGPRYYYRHRYYGPGPAAWAVGPVGAGLAIAAAPFGGYGPYAYYGYGRRAYYYDGPEY